MRKALSIFTQNPVRGRTAREKGGGGGGKNSLGHGSALEAVKTAAGALISQGRRGRSYEKANKKNGARKGSHVTMECPLKQGNVSALIGRKCKQGAEKKDPRELTEVGKI